jgi:hypothetical protein
MKERESYQGRLTLPIVSVLLQSLLSCELIAPEEDDTGGGSGSPESIPVENAQDLMEAVDIPGGTRASGSVPAPEGNGGTTLELDTSEIILTANSDYSLGYSVTGGSDDPVALYVEFDGADEHFVIDLTEPSSQVVANSTSGARTIRGRPGLTPSGVYQGSSLDVSTTVRSYSAPLQAGVPDFSFINDSNRWSDPVTVTTRAVSVGSGTLQASLTWNTTADLDLWVEEPDGTTIAYYNSVSSTTGGQLDVDDVDGYGPENIFYEETPPAGTYTVKVDHFSGASPTNYTVTITNNGSTQSYSGSISSNQTATIDTVQR